MASKLAGLLIAAGPKRSAMPEPKTDDMDEDGASEDSGEMTMDPDEMVAMLKDGKGYTSSGECVKPNMKHPDMKNPNHPVVRALRAFAEEHERATMEKGKPEMSKPERDSREQ